MTFINQSINKLNNQSIYYSINESFPLQESESANEEDGSISSEGERRYRAAPQAPAEGEAPGEITLGRENSSVARSCLPLGKLHHGIVFLEYMFSLVWFVKLVVFIYRIQRKDIIFIILCQ